MTNYRWEIKTSDAPYSGTDGSVTLSLHGSDGITDDITIDSDSFSKGETATGIIQADADLGDIASASLYAKLDEGRPWKIDSIRIVNTDTGASWIADDVGECTEEGCPVIRFKPEDKKDKDDSSEPTPPPVAEGDSGGSAQDDSEASPVSPIGVPERPRSSASGGADSCAKRKGGGLGRLLVQLKKSLEMLLLLQDPAQAEIGQQIVTATMPLLRKLYALRNGTPIEKSPDQLTLGEGGLPSRQQNPAPPATALPATPSVPTQVRDFVTLELYATISGNKTQLGYVLSRDALGGLHLKAGARIIITSSATEGFGLAGKPGAWSFGNPQGMGFDSAECGVVSLDGFEVRPVSVSFLSKLFIDWKKVINDCIKQSSQGAQ